MTREEMIAAGLNPDEQTSSQNTPPENQSNQPNLGSQNNQQNTANNTNQETAPSLEELMKRMEDSTKAQIELLEKKYNDRISEINKQLEEEKLKTMTEKEREEHNKKLELQKQVAKEEALLKEINDLRNEKIKADNLKFVSDVVSTKPYLKEIVEKMGIKDELSYNNYIKPLEAQYKTWYDMQNYYKSSTNRDVFSPYAETGMFTSQNNNLDFEAKLKANASKLLDDIL